MTFCIVHKLAAATRPKARPMSNAVHRKDQRRVVSGYFDHHSRGRWVDGLREKPNLAVQLFDHVVVLFCSIPPRISGDFVTRSVDINAPAIHATNSLHANISLCPPDNLQTRNTRGISIPEPQRRERFPREKHTSEAPMRTKGDGP